MGMRETMNEKPWLGWIVAALLFVVAAFFAWRSLSSGGDMYSADRMTEIVTIKFTDTDDTIEMPRGRLIKQLLEQGGTLDPGKGLINPKTQQPTGFLFNKSEWDRMISELNADRAAAGPVKGPKGK